jgi:hypothetical protein
MSDVSGIIHRGVASKHAGLGLHVGFGVACSTNLNVERIWLTTFSPFTSPTVIPTNKITIPVNKNNSQLVLGDGATGEIVGTG